MADAFIGCSGFNYRHWRGNFYPEKLPQKKWFEHYCTIFSTVELNVTFYRLPAPETFAKWYRETPASFVFAIKGSRFITHVKRLADAEEAVHRYFNSALNLQEKLKVVLWQFPPGFQANTERLHHFLGLLKQYPVRQTFEFRHESWLSPETYDLCRAHGANVCMADWPEFLVQTPPTADFVYIRRHGHDRSYTGCYSPEEIAADASRIEDYLRKEEDVFIYFNNDLGGHAPRNAADLRQLLATEPSP